LLRRCGQRDRQAIERPERDTRGAPRVGRAGKAARQLGLDGHECVEFRVCPRDSRKVELGEFQRRHVAARQRVGKPGERRERVDGHRNVVSASSG
jgi:hypothetical protein